MPPQPFRRCSRGGSPRVCVPGAGEREDADAFDLNFLGQAGVIPGWPGEEAAPAQQMVAQTRAVLERYAENGGSYAEEVFAGAGHAPALERPERFVELLLQHVRGAA